MTELERLSTEVVVRATALRRTVATAESLTAGLISATLAGVSGASAVLMGGVVSYDPRVKHELLHVPQDVIDGVGVVSEPCARQMAVGARQIIGADVAVSATGVAGPTGGTPETPVGTVFLGIADAYGSDVAECRFAGDRQSVRVQTVQKALEMILERLN